jgi:hypothetical protein
MKVMPGAGGFMVRLQRGEEIHEQLTAFAREQGIRGAAVAGVGALEDVEVGFFNRGARRYDRCLVPEATELLSLTGNLSLKEGAPFLHAHVVLMRSDFSVAGGHLFRGRIAITGEFSVTLTGLSMRREFDDEVGLALLEPHD